MVRVVIPKTIIARVAQHDGLSKALSGFIECIQTGQTPPRIYKPSGVARDGTRFEPYLHLKLHHHHLHRNPDPLLVTQHVDDTVYGIALATHASYFDADKMLWLRDNALSIDWTDSHDLYETVKAYRP